MTLKRPRDEDVAIEATAEATCLMLLSKVGSSDDQEPSTENSSDSDTSLAAPGQRVYSCKTCSKRFHSFQALGGHRASHKKIRLVAELMTSPEKVKRHECPLCGLEFPSGQALGGHMRRHRAELEGKKDHDKAAPLQSVVLKRSNSSKRVFGLDLDLNLTPYENDVKLGGKTQSTATVSPLFSALFCLNSTV